MGYFFWCEKLSIGNTMIDSDHRKLIDLISSFHAAMEQGHGKEGIEKVLNELIKYTQEHFKREEGHMRRIRYAAFATHKREHDLLIKEVLDLQRNVKDGTALLTIQVSKFLFNWLFEHIMSEDKKLGGGGERFVALPPPVSPCAGS